MRYEIVLTPEAVENLRQLSARDASTIRDAIESHLRFEPTKESKSRIKRLQNLRQPQYRLRVNEHRVYYDIAAEQVWVLAVIPKSLAAQWLGEWSVEP